MTSPNDMPAKIDENVLTARDAEIFNAHILNKHSLDKTAEFCKVSRETVKRTKKKPAFRELQIASIKHNKFGHDEWAKRMIDLTKAKKEINVGGKLQEIDDNVARFNALTKIGDIWGVDAPQKHDLTHTMQQMSDAELDEQLAESIEEFEEKK